MDRRKVLPGYGSVVLHRLDTENPRATWWVCWEFPSGQHEVRGFSPAYGDALRQFKAEVTRERRSIAAREAHQR